MNNDTNQENVQSPERRKALKAVAKYSTVLVGTSTVVLSSADALKAAPGSGACGNSNGNANGC